MYVRIHEQVGPNTVKQLPFVENTETGEIKSYSITNPRTLSAKNVQRIGGIIKTKKEMATKNLSVAEMAANKRIAPQVQAIETPYGNIGLERQEMPGVGEARRLLTVTITNTEATTESVVLGDGLGHIKDLMSIGVPKAGVTFDGTLGSTSYTALQEMSKMMPLRFKGIQFQAFDSLGVKSDAYFNSGSFRSAVVDPLQYTINNPYLSFSDLVQQDSFNTNIRKEDNYRFLLCPISGLVVTLPTATRVTINLPVQSYGAGYNMLLFG